MQIQCIRIEFSLKKQLVMSLEISGKIVQIMDEVGGTSARGNAWRKQEFVIETNDQFPKKICMSVWGDKVADLKAFSEGDEVTASINIESREFKERWYTDVRAWKLQKAQNEFSQERPFDEGGAEQSATTTFSSDAEMDDLPF